VAFTDADLKRLKEWAEFPSQRYARSRNDVKALLARLEAAELCSESCDDLLHHGFIWPNGAKHEAKPELAKERLESWRKSKGELK
jgi:hypothetical protein